MTRIVLAALSVLSLLAGRLVAADEQKPSKAVPVVITKVDPRKGEITVRYEDGTGKGQQKTLSLTRDVHYLDETGRVVNVEVFEAGQDALVVVNEGKLTELRRVTRPAPAQRLSDAVRTLIEMTDCEAGCTAEVQRIYDMLRKLDTAKNGTIDPQALKAESNRIVEERVRNAIQRLDANKDGKISREEAKGLIKEHFDRIDTNRDGFIDHDELLKAAKERREARAAEAKSSVEKPSEKEKK